MMQRGLTTGVKEITLTDKEQKLIERLRKVDFGVVEVIMINGQPDRTERIRESEKL